MMCGKRVVVPHRLKPLHQIAGRLDLDPAAAHEIHGPGVDARHIRDGAVARVLHRHSLHPAQQLRQPRVELLSTGIDVLAARQRVERPPLNRMHQAGRLARRGHQIEPSARRHLGAVGGSQQPCSDGIGTVEIVEKPAIQVRSPEGFLYSCHVKRHEKSV